MSTPVNLNKARKAKARDAAKKTADANATKFGRTRVEKDQAKAKAEKAARDLEGHKRE